MEILENISLKYDNTFGIDVIAKYYYTIDSAEAFIALSQTEIFQNNKYLLLGGGSNVFSAGTARAVVIPAPANPIAPCKNPLRVIFILSFKFCYNFTPPFL